MEGEATEVADFAAGLDAGIEFFRDIKAPLKGTIRISTTASFKRLKRNGAGNLSAKLMR